MCVKLSVCLKLRIRKKSPLETGKAIEENTFLEMGDSVINHFTSVLQKVYAYTDDFFLLSGDTIVLDHIYITPLA